MQYKFLLRYKENALFANIQKFPRQSANFPSTQAQKLRRVVPHKTNKPPIPHIEKKTPSLSPTFCFAKPPTSEVIKRQRARK